MDITTLFTSKKTILFPFQKMMGNLQITFCLITLFRITTGFSIGNSGDFAQNCNFPNYLFSFQLFINKKTNDYEKVLFVIRVNVDGERMARTRSTKPQRKRPRANRCMANRSMALNMANGKPNDYGIATTQPTARGL